MGRRIRRLTAFAASCAGAALLTTILIAQAVKGTDLGWDDDNL